MNRTVELDRVIYTFENVGDNRLLEETRLLLVQQQAEDGKVSWVPLCKGWDYSLWETIGERGGLCEAEELTLMKDGKERVVPIEEYVQLYRKEIAVPIPIEQVFDRFVVRVKAWCLKDTSRTFMIERFEKEWNLNKTREEDGKIHYQKNITTVEELGEIWSSSHAKDYNVQMYFVELPTQRAS